MDNMGNKDNMGNMGNKDNIENSSFYRYWGKAERTEKSGSPSVNTENAETAKAETTYHLLPYHCLDVAAVGKVLLEKDNHLSQILTNIIGLDKKIYRSWLLFFLTLHDLGKFAEGFQNLRPDLLHKLQGRFSDRGYAVRHDSLGFLLWEQRLRGMVWSEGLLELVAPEIEKRQWQKAFDCLARSVSGHHGQPPKAEGPNKLKLSLSRHFGPAEIDDAKDFVRQTGCLLLDKESAKEITISPKELKLRLRKASWILAGLAVLCDWIASGHFPFLMEAMPLSEYWSKCALPRAGEAIEKVGILPTPPASRTAHTRLFPSIEVLTPLQTMVANCSIGEGPQLFILEDVTGSGKTEAALILASRLMGRGHGTGFFMALPTMATSNAMYDRLTAAYQRLFAEGTSPSLVLSHSASRLSKTFRQSILDRDVKEPYLPSYAQDDDTASAQCAAWLADNRKKSLLADVGAGTIDQTLLAVLPSRHQSLRLLGLVQHILIVDEVHGYDPYMHNLLQNLLHFQASMGGSAILLSATLPLRIRQDLVNSFNEGLGINVATLHQRNAYPLLTQVSCSGATEIPIEARPHSRVYLAIKLIDDLQDIEKLIISAAKAGKCVCWIRNTVDDALSAYELLQTSLDTSKLLLFHARLALGDRLAKEEEVCKTFGRKSRAEQRRGKVLVATQVIEQSLNLDFDVMISDLSPMDLLIQRAGRLHRHARDAQGNPLLARDTVDQREPPCFFIFSPLPEEDAGADWYKDFFPKGAYVYPSHGRLWLTASLLYKKRGWKMPDEARELIEAAFSAEAEEKIPDSLLRRDQEADVQRMVDGSLAKLNGLKLEEGYKATADQWLDDTHTPTRLGEVQTTVRLARWDGKRLSPWYKQGDSTWDLSQLSIRNTLVNSEDGQGSLALRQAIASLKERLPDQGKWSVLVPLVFKEGLWQGKARDSRGRLVTLHYGPATGLKVFREED